MQLRYPEITTLVKKTLVICVISAVSVYSYGQNQTLKEQPNWNWIQKIDGERTQRINDICEGLNGDIIVLGQFENGYGADLHVAGQKVKLRLNDTLTPHKSGSFLARYSASGRLIWFTSITSQDEVYSRGLHVDSKGNILITGQFKYAAHFHSTYDTDPLKIIGKYTPEANSRSLMSPDKPANLFIAKYNSNGHPLWAKAGISKSGSLGYEVKTDEDDNIYVRGYCTYDPISLGEISYLPVKTEGRSLYVGNCPMVLIKCNSSGKEDWVIYASGHANFGNGSGSGYQSLLVSPKGEISVKSLLVGEVHLISSEGWIQKIEGTEKPQQNVIIDSKGRFDRIEPTVDFDFDHVITDRRGNIIKTPSHLGFRNRITQVDQDNDGNYYVLIQSWCDAQYICTLDFDGTEYTTDRYDVLLAKYDANKKVIWVNYLGGPSRQYGHDMAVDQNNNVYVTGAYINKLEIIDQDQADSLNSERMQYFVTSFSSEGKLNWATNSAMQFEFNYDYIMPSKIVITKENKLVLAGNHNMPAHLSGNDIALTGRRRQLNYTWAKGKGWVAGQTDAFITSCSLQPEDSIITDSSQLGKVLANTIQDSVFSFTTLPTDTQDIQVKILRNAIDVTVFPNPTTSKVTVSVDLGSAKTDIRFKLLNANGTELSAVTKSSASGLANQEISFDDYANGIYYVVVEAGDFKATKKVVVF